MVCSGVWKKGRWNFFSGPGQFFYLTFFLSYGFIKVAAPFKEFSHPPLISYLDIYREFLVNVVFVMRKSLHIVDFTLSESTTKKLLNNSLKCLTQVIVSNMPIWIKFTLMESTFSEDPLYVVSWKQFKKNQGASQEGG